mmetsp:Transcript_16519/g.62840  ORF Transcript_16519/g.62840 Transcript_16519/m.62840 type:complete len:81 (+) Transcript_16519:428-670(+)
MSLISFPTTRRRPASPLNGEELDSSGARGETRAGVPLSRPRLVPQYRPFVMEVQVRHVRAEALPFDCIYRRDRPAAAEVS